MIIRISGIDDKLMDKFELLSSQPPSTHLCPPEDIFHSYGPRLCPPCSSTSPGWGGSAARARSPWPRTRSGSTGPAQLETLTEETKGFHLGMIHLDLPVEESHFENGGFNVVRGERLRERFYSPTHRCLSSTKPALQEHLKLPSVFRQSPFWHTPCIEHSLISSSSGGGV